MPCNGDGYECEDQKAEIDKLSAYLCEACRTIGDSKKLSPALKAWWGRHVDIDRRREEGEVRSAAIDKRAREIMNDSLRQRGDVPTPKEYDQIWETAIRHATISWDKMELQQGEPSTQPVPAADKRIEALESAVARILHILENR